MESKLELAEENLKNYKEKEKVTSLSQESYEILRRVTEAEVLYNRALSEAGSIGEQLRYIEGEISKQRSDVISSVTQITSPYINRLKSNLVDLELQLTDLEIKNYNEAFLTGTAAEITPIKSIDNIIYITGKNTLSFQLMNDFTNLVNSSS